MREFTSLYSDLEQTLTMADWHRHRDAEQQRLHDKKEGTMNREKPVEKIEESILSVGDRVKVDNPVWQSSPGKVVRLHHTGEIVVRHDSNGAEHHHSPQDIKKA